MTFWESHYSRTQSLVITADFRLIVGYRPVHKQPSSLPWEQSLGSWESSDMNPADGHRKRQNMVLSHRELKGLETTVFWKNVPIAPLLTLLRKTPNPQKSWSFNQQFLNTYHVQAECSLVHKVIFSVKYYYLHCTSEKTASERWSNLLRATHPEVNEARKQR